MSENKIKVQYTMEEIITLATQVATKVAFEKFQNLTQESLTERHERRLRNTKELLKNFINLKFHAKKAIYCAKHKMPTAFEILDEIEHKESTLFIESIRESSARTFIIVKHIEQMLQFYKYLSKADKNLYGLKWTLINDLYLVKDKKNIDEIAEEMRYSRAQAYRHLEYAIKDLSGLIFGIDGIKLQKSMIQK